MAERKNTEQVVAALEVEVANLKARLEAAQTASLRHDEEDDRRFAAHGEKIEDIGTTVTKLVAYGVAALALLQVIGTAVTIWAAMR